MYAFEMSEFQKSLVVLALFSSSRLHHGVQDEHMENRGRDRWNLRVQTRMHTGSHHNRRFRPPQSHLDHHLQ